MAKKTRSRSQGPSKENLDRLSDIAAGFVKILRAACTPGDAAFVLCETTARVIVSSGDEGVDGEQLSIFAKCTRAMVNDLRSDRENEKGV